MDGIYALADPSSALAAINMNDEFNIFGKKAYLIGHTFTTFPPIDDAPVQKVLAVAAPEVEEGSWWENLALGAIASAALGGLAYVAFGAVTVATAGIPFLIAGICLAGVAAATATVTAIASYEDARSGHTRTRAEFVSQLIRGGAIGGMTSATIYGIWNAIPAASAMLGGELAALFSSSIITAEKFTQQVEKFTQLSARAGYLLMAAQAVRGASEIECTVNGYHWMLDKIFRGNEANYSDVVSLMDGLSSLLILIGVMSPRKVEGERPGDVTKKVMMDTGVKGNEGPGKLNIDDAQFGKKVGKHAQDYGLDPADPNARNVIKDTINEIFGNPTEIRQGEWMGLGEKLPSGANAPGQAKFYIQGNDVVITDLQGNFVTIMKDGVNNLRVQAATTTWP